MALTYYEKQSVETVISARRLGALFAAITDLSESFTSLLSTWVLQFQGKDSNLVDRHGAAREWLESRMPGQFVIDAFLAADEHLVVVALNDLQSLTTAFGKKHRRRHNLAYVQLYHFATSAPANPTGGLVGRLCALLRERFRLRDPPSTRSICRNNKTYQHLRDCPRDIDDPQGQELHLVTGLADSNLRNVALRAKQLKEPTTKNIADSVGLPLSEARSLIERGLTSGLLARRYNVRCGQCHQVLARVGSIEDLQPLVATRVACPSCGTTVSEDSHEDIYGVEDAAAHLLDGSKWMTLFVRSELAKYGVTRVCTQVIDGPNELDIVANIDGSLLLMELKDRRFSMGHAWPFVGKCTQYKPDIAMVVATDGVDLDVRDFAANLDLEVTLVGGLSQLKDSLDSILSALYTQRFLNVLLELPWEGIAADAALRLLGHRLPAQAQFSGLSGQRRAWMRMPGNE